MQHVGHRVRVTHHWHGTVGQLPIQKEPGVRLLLRGRSQSLPETEPSSFEELAGRRKNARVLRSIEVEAARVVAASQTKRLERHFHEVDLSGVRKIGGA